MAVFAVYASAYKLFIDDNIFNRDFKSDPFVMIDES